MSMNDARSAEGKFGRGPTFYKDARGYTCFYPLGPRLRGYVVPDYRREQALREAVVRYARLDIPLGYVVIPLVVISMWSLDGPHGLFALAVLVLTVAAAIGFKAWQRRCCFGPLLQDLERAEAADKAGRKESLIFLSVVFGIGILLAIVRINQIIHSN